MIGAGSASRNLHPFLGRIIGTEGQTIGTCFQVDQGVLVTDLHVVYDAGGTGVGAQVQFAQLDGPDDFLPAQVVAIDETFDLAVLISPSGLAASVPFLCYSETQAVNTDFRITGFAQMSRISLDDHFRFATAPGVWEAAAQRPDGRLCAKGNANGVHPGMSGAPALRLDDDAVIGVLTERFNSSDGWSAGRVMMTRVEDLEPLLTGVASVYIDRRRTAGAGVGNAKLTQTPLARDRIGAAGRFFKPEIWTADLASGAEAIKAGGVLIVAAHPGTGATTFAERILAKDTDAQTRLIRLDPGDWNSPFVQALPIQPRTAYLLDLRDPDHDRPDQKFVDDLVDHSRALAELGSVLIVTVTRELWKGRFVRTADFIRALILPAPPADELVASYVEILDSDLSPIVTGEDVARLLRGRTAVRAVESLDAIIEAGQPRSGDDESSPAKRIVEVLQDHAEILDRFFGDLASNQNTLSPSDRYLALRIAFGPPVRLEDLDTECHKLEAILTGTPRATARTAPEILAGPSLKGRLQAIEAYVSPGEIVRFADEDLGSAATRYVWENYAPIRRVLTEWLLELARTGSDEAEHVTELLSTLIRRIGDVNFIKTTLAPASVQPDQAALLTRIVLDAWQDQHMQRSCERLLYDWAKAPGYQEAVIEICAGIARTPTRRRDIALTRLRRVADSAKQDEGVRARVLTVFRMLAQDPVHGAWFAAAASKMFTTAPFSMSTKLAFLALLGTSTSGTPWLFMPSQIHDERLDKLLGKIIYDDSLASDVVAAMNAMAESAFADDAAYAETVDRFGRIIAANGVFRAFLRLGDSLNEVGARYGRQLVDDIDARIARLTSSSEGREGHELG